MHITTIEHPIKQIHQANLITIGKYKPLSAIDWKKINIHDLFLGEDSTIEWVPIYIYAPTRKDVTSHIVRHTKQHPRFVVQSGRPDWTGKERPPHDAYTEFMLCVNPLSLINMAKQRLCFKAMKETREWMEDVVKCMKAYADRLDNAARESRSEEADDALTERATFFSTLARILVPDCVYRGQCCQRKSCGLYDELYKADTLTRRYLKYHKELESWKRDN